MKIDVSAAREKIKDYPYSLVYMFDRVVLTEVCDLADIDWENCYEIRSFGEKGELRIRREEDGFAASEILAEGESIITEYVLDGRFSDKWKTVSVRRFIDYDEDGQAYIAETALSGLGGN